MYIFVSLFQMAENDNAINKLIKEVAVLKWVAACNTLDNLIVYVTCRKVSGKSVFELKDEHLDSYDPFYYHYSKVEQSKVWGTYKHPPHKM